MLDTKEKQPAQTLSDSQEKNPVTTPKEAASKLELLGYTRDFWPQVMDQTKGSHYIRALINVANGEEARSLDDVYHDQFPDKIHQTEDDVDAEQASDTAAELGKWDDFTGNNGKLAVVLPPAAGELVIRAERAAEEPAVATDERRPQAG